ncbi:MAG: TatD family hydrolase [Bacteriovoracaceae bacterium]|nr:TatD family hydrolase [Bacteriovoracaceae bacterium]
MIETHCHLDYLKQLPLEEIVEESKRKGVEKIITISVDPDNFNKVTEIANHFPEVYCTQGIHPHDAKLFTEEVYQGIKTNTQTNKKVVAIGEIGLDYHYNNSLPEVQKEVFKRQLQLACELKKPVVIHTRDADEDTEEILKSYLPRLTRKGVVHSFTSGIKLAKFALSNGFYLGFNGIITFKKADLIRDVLAITPLEQILIETDAPFLTPVPHRGKENAPFYLEYIVEKIAELKQVPVDEVRKITTENAQKLFQF